ncbi:MAG: hypothetical protein U0T74_00155 [Chitinophagales bacterium]
MIQAKVIFIFAHPCFDPKTSFQGGDRSTPPPISGSGFILLPGMLAGIAPQLFVAVGLGEAFNHQAQHLFNFVQGLGIP